MIAPATHFEQLVDISGYAIATAYYSTTQNNARFDAFLNDEQQCFDVLVSLGQETHNFKRIFPLRDNPALFKDFAELDHSNSAIRCFANSYGLLGIHNKDDQNAIYISIDGDENLKKTNFNTIEALNKWRNEINAMRFANECWNALTIGQSDFLDKVLDTKGGFEDLTDMFFLEDNMNIPAKKDLIYGYQSQPSSLVTIIEEFINSRLKHCIPALEPLNMLSSFRMEVVPITLLSALWLQFADAVCHQKKFRKCDMCGSWFEAKKHSRNGTKKYCSNACRVRAYRSRRIEQGQS